VSEPVGLAVDGVVAHAVAGEVEQEGVSLGRECRVSVELADDPLADRLLVDEVGNLVALPFERGSQRRTSSSA